VVSIGLLALVTCIILVWLAFRPPNGNSNLGGKPATLPFDPCLLYDSLEAPHLAVDFFYDATVSMKGYVVPNEENAYKSILRNLKLAAVPKMRKETPLRFFRFGTVIQSLDSNSLDRVFDTGFYAGEEVNLKTFIEGVVSAADIERLTIFVTDFFQEMTDYTALVLALKEKYADSSLAVGLLGVRSTYQGEVYDIGSNRDHFYYDCRDKSAAYRRPFYVFFLGRHADIQNYYERLWSLNPDGYPEAHFLMFSPYLTNLPGSFVSAEVGPARGIYKDALGYDFSPSEIKAGQFTIQREPDTPWLDISVKYSVLNNIPVLNFDSLQMEYSSLRLSSKEWKSLPADKQPLRIDLLQITDSSVSMKLMFDRRRFDGPGDYAFNIKHLVRHQAVSLPAWVNDWTMDLADLPKWRDNPGLFDGSRTVYLNTFCTALLQVYLNMKTTPVTDLWLVFRVGG
jgi:hypothetical protein